MRVLEGHTGPVDYVVLLRDRQALSASRDHTLRLWDLATGATLRLLKGHSGGVSYIVLLRDGRALSASADNTLRLWNTDTGDTISVVAADEKFNVIAVDEALNAGLAGTTGGRVVFFEIGERCLQHDLRMGREFLNLSTRHCHVHPR